MKDQRSVELWDLFWYKYNNNKY